MTVSEQPHATAPIDKRLVAFGILVLLVAVGLAVGTALVISKGDPDKLEKLEQAWMRTEAAQHERQVQTAKFAAEEALATVARNNWVALAARAEQALTTLDSLPEQASRWSATIEDVSRNETGKRLSGVPELVAEFDALTSTKAPPGFDPEALAAARSALVGAKEAAAKAARGAPINEGPSAALVEQVSVATRAVADISNAYAGAFAKLEKLKDSSSLSAAPTNGATLADALQEYRAEQKRAEYTEFLGAFRESMEAAQETIRQTAREAAQSIADERVRGIREIAAAVQSQEVAMNEAAATKLRGEHEAERAVAEQELAEVARRKAAIEAETKKTALIARCHEADVRETLAPFLSKGYYQPGAKSLSLEKAPMSYAALQEVGALQPTARGIGLLLSVGSSSKNDRQQRLAKLPFIDNFDVWFSRNLDRYEEGKKIQKLLIELGPTLVEEKLLSP